MVYPISFFKVFQKVFSKNPFYIVILLNLARVAGILAGFLHLAEELSLDFFLKMAYNKKGIKKYGR